MRNTKTFEIEGLEKPITVYELSVKQIIGLMSEDLWSSKDTSVEGLKIVMDERVLPFCCTIKMGDFIEMAPSDIQKVWDEFKEVNSTFFVIARKTGIMESLEEMIVKVKETLKEAIIEDFSKLVVPSLKQVTSTS